MKKSIYILLTSVVMFSFVGCSTVKDTSEEVNQVSADEKVPAGILGKYECEKVKNIFDVAKKSDDSIVISAEDLNPVELKRVMSASGAKFENERYQWWSKGDIAYFSDTEKKIDSSECIKK